MNIAILGYGVEGESVYKYYSAMHPGSTFTVYDNNSQPSNTMPEGVKFVGDVKDFKGIQAELIVKSPSIPPWQVDVTGELTTVTREFLKNCPAPVIGVTGTKGKGTTCSLIKAMFDATGKKTWLVGNIGVSALDVLGQISPKDIVIYELSSFQLWDCDVSPHIAVVLGIESEHLDVHKDFNDYLLAKANIAKYQKSDDIVIYREGNQYSEYISKVSPASTKISYPSDTSAHIKESMFYYGESELFSVAALKLAGSHNRDNLCAAIAAVWPWLQDGFDMERGVETFEGLPHRLKLVGSVNDVQYFDDSIATTPGSAIAAMSAFDSPKVLILGGSSKGASYDELAKKIKASMEIRRVFLIGAESSKIEMSLKNASFARYTNLGSEVTMTDIVKSAANVAESGDVVILSPACASFDMFKSYSDRGDKFIEAVKNL